ncbi:MAG: hypothetical protein P1V97_28660 [Planctomycetota bacterium]|nr:hypothetical protein [Planctomycetota bacterium]
MEYADTISKVQVLLSLESQVTPNEWYWDPQFSRDADGNVESTRYHLHTAEGDSLGHTEYDVEGESETQYANAELICRMKDDMFDICKLTLKLVTKVEELEQRLYEETNLRRRLEEMARRKF